MSDINISFSRTHIEIERANLAFVELSPMGKLIQRFGLAGTSLLALIVLLYLNRGGIYEISILGERQSFIESLLSLCLLIPFSLALGFIGFTLLKIFRKLRMISGLTRLPPDFFGEATVAMDETGIALQAPMFQLKYDWRLLDSVLATPEFVFVCSGNGLRQNLAVWIPMAALGDHSEDTVSRIHGWLEKPKNQAPVEETPPNIE